MHIIQQCPHRLDWYNIEIINMFKGIWLCEHRDHPSSRRVVVTLNGIWGAEICFLYFAFVSMIKANSASEVIAGYVCWIAFFFDVIWVPCYGFNCEKHCDYLMDISIPNNYYSCVFPCKVRAMMCAIAFGLGVQIFLVVFFSGKCLANVFI